MPKIFIKTIRVTLLTAFVVLSSEQIKGSVVASYCFNDTTRADVFNEAGLPLAPFCTDKTNND